MANNNVQNIKFLRNGSLFETREAARTALETYKSLGADGSAILARYSGGTVGEDYFVKTLVGFIYDDSVNKYITIIDVDDAGTDAKAYVDSLVGSGITSANTVTAQLEALSGNSSTDTSATTSVAGAKIYADDLIATLDYTDTAVAGEYVSQVSEADGKISVTRVALPDASTVSGESKVVIDVTQDKGAITATAANLTGVKLDGLTTGSDAKIAATNTLGEALANIQAQIDAMDKAADAEDGKVVTTVTEEDGKVTETKANVKDLQLGGYSKDTSATGDIASGDTINAALSKLENKAAAITIANADGSINVSGGTSGTDINVNIKTGEHVIAKDGSDGLYTDIKLSAVTPSSTAVKDEYSLVGTDGSVLGTNIKIYKDSHIVRITYITNTGDTHYQNLEYVYIDASGETKTEYVDISSLVLESEFASGITVTDHVAHGVVDPTSEKDESNVAFLTVGTDGFKISGIKDAIDTKVNKLDAVVTGGTTAGTATSNHIQVVVGEADGKLTGVTVTETNIANADDLATLSGKTITEVESSNASISATTTATTDGTVKVDVVTDASKIKMTGFTAAESGFTAITSASTVTEAVKAVETEMIANEQTTASALVDLDAKIKELSGDSSSALTAEIAARKAVDGINGDAYSANTSANYISAATSLNDADQRLDAALKVLDGDVIKSVKVNNVTLAESSNAVNVQITAATTAGTTSDNKAIVVTTGNDGSITLALADIDAGVYDANA